MLDAIPVIMKKEVRDEFSRLSEDNRVGLNMLIHHQAKSMIIRSTLSGMLHAQFAVTILLTATALLALDMSLLGDISLSTHIGATLALCAFALVGALIAFYRSYKGSRVSVTTMKEGGKPLVMHDGSLYFVVYCYNSFTEDGYGESFWTGKRGFWEDVRHIREMMETKKA